MQSIYNQQVISEIQISYTNIPLAVFLIGANGSGKSTLRNYLNLTDIQTNIDPDVLNRICQGSKPPQDKQNYLIKAARLALTMFNDAIKNNLNLCIETTLAGSGSMQRIRQAKKQGYYTIAYFVGLNDVKLNLARIKQRVNAGGHDIAENVVRRRYHESLTHFKKIQTCFNKLYVLDNSSPQGYELQLIYTNNQLEQQNQQLQYWVIENLFNTNYL